MTSSKQRVTPVASLTVSHLTVRYNNGQKAIDDLNFHLDAGTTCALVGVNGSGKSTLFKSIMGLISPTQGSVEVCGGSVQYALKNNLLAYVPQAEEVDWQFPISVFDVVMMGRYGYMNFLRRPKAEDHEIVFKALNQLDILPLQNKPIGQLSGGQKKRVFLARALAQDAPIILLDEPFTGVDVKTELIIMRLLSELREQGKLILVSTHNLGTVPEYCDHVVMIKSKLIAYGDTATIYNEKNLEQTFGGFLRHFKVGDEQSKSQEHNVVIISDDERPAVFYKKNRGTDADKKKSS